MNNERLKKALIIAVSDYCNPDLESLDFFKKTRQDNLIGMINHQSMADRIYDFFTDDNLKTENKLIFYYSGHGVPAEFHMIVTSQNQQPTNNIKWIENGILQNPLPDHRKYIIWRILSPYLLNVKKLPKEESYSTIKDWLDKCNKIEKLNFNAKIKIREGIKGASKGYFPISLAKLKNENKQLYDTIVKRAL
jgi:hypothetical protein